jgi:hypothetical protein
MKRGKIERIASTIQLEKGGQSLKMLVATICNGVLVRLESPPERDGSLGEPNLQISHVHPVHLGDADAVPELAVGDVFQLRAAEQRQDGVEERPSLDDQGHEVADVPAPGRAPRFIVGRELRQLAVERLKDILLVNREEIGYCSKGLLNLGKLLLHRHCCST